MPLLRISRGGKSVELGFLGKTFRIRNFRKTLLASLIFFSVLLILILLLLNYMTRYGSETPFEMEFRLVTGRRFDSVVSFIRTAYPFLEACSVPQTNDTINDLMVGVFFRIPFSCAGSTYKVITDFNTLLPPGVGLAIPEENVSEVFSKSFDNKGLIDKHVVNITSGFGVLQLNYSEMTVCPLRTFFKDGVSEEEGLGMLIEGYGNKLLFGVSEKPAVNYLGVRNSENSAVKRYAFKINESSTVLVDFADNYFMFRWERE